MDQVETGENGFHGEAKTHGKTVIQKIWVHLGVGSSLVCLEWSVCVYVCVCVCVCVCVWMA